MCDHCYRRDMAEKMERHWRDAYEREVTAREQAEARVAVVADERDRLLDEFPCPAHGRCVPYAIKAVRKLRARIEELEGLLDKGIEADGFHGPGWWEGWFAAFDGLRHRAGLDKQEAATGANDPNFHVGPFVCCRCGAKIPATQGVVDCEAGHPSMVNALCKKCAGTEPAKPEAPREWKCGSCGQVVGPMHNLCPCGGRLIPGRFVPEEAKT